MKIRTTEAWTEFRNIHNKITEIKKTKTYLFSKGIIYETS